jgi:hypothetical protein
MANSFLEQNWVTEGQKLVENIVKTWSDQYKHLVKYIDRSYTDFM